MVNPDQGTGPVLQQHPLVDALSPQPSDNPPDVVVLDGYLGRGTAPGIWRLYLNPELTQYVEIEESRFRHVERLSDAEGDRVWVSTDTPLSQFRILGRAAQAEFLQGSERLAGRVVPLYGGGPSVQFGRFPLGGGSTPVCFTRSWFHGW